MQWGLSDGFHACFEVWLGGEWRLFDPTDNIAPSTSCHLARPRCDERRAHDDLRPGERRAGQSDVFGGGVNAGGAGAFMPGYVQMGYPESQSLPLTPQGYGVARRVSAGRLGSVRLLREPQQNKSMGRTARRSLVVRQERDRPRRKGDLTGRLPLLTAGPCRSTVLRLRCLHPAHAWRMRAVVSFSSSFP